MSKISIIIANYNGEKYLKTCLESVLAIKTPAFEVLITDDGSTDKSVDLIKDYQKIDGRIKLFRNKNNLGASASRNRAIKKARGRILVFLDNDTEVSEDWLKNLIRPLSSKSIGAAQSVLLDFHNRELIQNAGGKFMPQTGWLLPIYQWHKYQKVKMKLKDLNIGAISASLAVKKEVIDKIGGFDELEAVTTEDLDFTWRVWIAGWRVVLAYDSIAYHWTKDINERKNMNTNIRKTYFHLAKNSFRSITKNYETKNMIINIVKSMFINFLRAFLVLFRRKQSSALIGTMMALVWYLFYFPSTIYTRRLVQGSRIFRDNKLMERVFVNESLINIYKKYFQFSKLL